MTRPSWIGYTLGGRYTIEALLGQGGMSAVYRAHDPNLRRTVAVKLIHAHLAGDDEFLRRFEAEAAAVAQLRHPNIVQVFDFNHDQDVYYMVMEFLPGDSLQARLKTLSAAGQRLPLAETASLMGSISEAVAYAHARGTIHRDLKPANVMLLPNGQPVLTDFGVAKIVGAQYQTATGAVLGTPVYMSPEQVRGESLDGRADIYSMGVMLYEMAAGRPPFEGDSAMTIMLKHVNEPIPDIRALVRDAPPALVKVLNRSLTKLPGERYQQASDLAAALRAIAIQPMSVADDTSVPPPRNATIIEPPRAVPPTGPMARPAVPSTQFEQRPAPPATQFEMRGAPAQGATQLDARTPAGPVGAAPQAPPAQAASPPVRKGMSPLAMVLGVGIAMVLCLVVVGSLVAALGGPSIMAALGGATATTGAPGDVTPATEIAAITDTAPTPEPGQPTSTDRPGDQPTDIPPPPSETPTPEPTATNTPVPVPDGMVLAPAGSFEMGGGDQADSTPRHTVTLSAFYIDQFEVTNERYLACLNAGGCTAPLRRSSDTRGSYFTEPAFAQYPVILIGWDQAQAFCQWEGKRLPTEAEWEYAATGGDGRRFPWGNEFDPGRVPVSSNDTVAVGSFPDGASPLGVYDMAGNVVEWVADWHDAQYYAQSPGENPTGPDTGTRRVMRGGSFGNADGAIYATTRRFARPANGADVDIGFRCAQPVE